MGEQESRNAEAGIASNILDIILNMMNSILRRSVEIKISNNSRNITLRNPRIHLDCGRCSVPPKPELRPGSSDTCCFLGTSPLWGVAGVLVYEAESFTLAIHFSNPIDYNKFPMELGLELSPGKAHLGSLEDTYTRMANSPNSASHLDIQFSRGVVVDEGHQTVQVSHGPIKVTATMSSDSNSCLKVVLEEQGEWGEEAGSKNPHGASRIQEK